MDHFKNKIEDIKSIPTSPAPLHHCLRVRARLINRKIIDIS